MIYQELVFKNYSIILKACLKEKSEVDEKAKVNCQVI